MDRIDCIVVGAGMVGLAVARALARSGREVLIIERERHFGTATSSRNSEVIHAGIYYPQGSLKATACRAGRDALYSYCADHGVPHRRTGKLIVATSDDEIAGLARLRAAAHANDVIDVDWADMAAVRAEHPALVGVAALRSPSTGIIDAHQYMLSLLGEAESAGAMIAYATRVARVEPVASGLAVTIDDDETPSLIARVMVNAAGLHAVDLAAAIDRETDLPPARYAKGNYFTLAGKAPFDTLVYPMPVAGGLGVHMTIDLAGAARFGPDVEWIDHIDYAVDPARAASFYAAIRRYWPGLPDGALQPGYAGIRPKLSGPGEPAADFRIDGPARHGIPGLINLLGIESPGLTASLAIADHVAALAA